MAGLRKNGDFSAAAEGYGLRFACFITVRPLHCPARRRWMTAAQALLRVQDVGVRFGGIVALDGVSFEVLPRQIVGLIGPNGAGKTTLFNCLSRLYQWDGGDIDFGGRSLRRVPRHGIAGLGIGRT